MSSKVNASPKDSENQPDKPKDSKLHALIDLQDNAYYKAIEETLTNCRPAPPTASSITTSKLEQKWQQKRSPKRSSRSPKSSKNSPGGKKNEHNDGRPIISTSFLDKTYHRLRGKFHRLRKKTSNCSTAVAFREHAEGCTGSNGNSPSGTEKITSTKIGGTDCDYVQETIIERSVMTASGVQTTTKHIIKRCDKNGHVDVEIEESIPKADKQKPKKTSITGLDENLPNDYFYESMHAITARENREHRIGGAGCGRPPTSPQPQIIFTPPAVYQPQSEFRAPPLCRPLPVTRPAPNQNRPCLCPQPNQQRQSCQRSSEALQEWLKNLCNPQKQQRQSCQRPSDVQESNKNRPNRPCQCTQQNKLRQSCLRSSDAHISALQPPMLSTPSAQSSARSSRANTADGIDHCLLDCCPALCRFCTKYLASKLSIQPDTIDQRTMNSFVVRNPYNGKATIDYFRVGEAMQQRERRKSEELERSRSVIDACEQRQADRGDRSRRSKSLSEIVQPIYKQPAKSPKKTNFRKARDEPQYVGNYGKRSRQRIPEDDAQMMPTEKKRRKKRELEPVQSEYSAISVERSAREKPRRPREQDVRQKVKAPAKEDACRPQYAERRGAVKKKASFDPSIGEEPSIKGKGSILKLPQAQKTEPRQPQPRQAQPRQAQPRQPQSRQSQPRQPQPQVSCTQSALSNQSSSEKYIYKYTHAQVQGLLKQALLAQQKLQAQQTKRATPVPQDTYTQTGASIQYIQGQSLVQAQSAPLNQGTFPQAVAPTQYPQAQSQGLAQPQPQPSGQASVPQYSTKQDPAQYLQTQDQGLKRIPSVSFAQPEQTIFEIPCQSLPTAQVSPQYAEAQDICMSCFALETGAANQYAQTQAQGMQQPQFAPYYQQTSPYIQSQAPGIGQVPAGPPQYSQVQQMVGPTPSQISIPPQCVQYLQQICSSMQFQQTPGPEKKQAPPGPAMTAKNSQKPAQNKQSSAAKASPARPSQTRIQKTRQASLESVSSLNLQAQNADMRRSHSCLSVCCPQYCQAQYPQAQAPIQYPQALTQYSQAQAPIQYPQALTQYPQTPSQYPQAPTQYPQAPSQFPQAPPQYPQTQGFDMYQSQPCNCGQPNCYPAPYYQTQTTNFRQASPGPIPQAGGSDIRQSQAFQYPQSQLGPPQYSQAQNSDIRLSQPCACKCCPSQHRLAQVPDYRQATSGQQYTQSEDSQQQLSSPSQYRPTKAPARVPVRSVAQTKRTATPNRAAQRPSFRPIQSGTRAALPDRRRPLNTNQKQLDLPKIRSSYSQADEDRYDEEEYRQSSPKVQPYRQSRGQVVSPIQSRIEESSPRRSISSQQRNLGQPRVDSRKQPAQTERSVKPMRQREPIDDYEFYSEGYESEPAARISTPGPRKTLRQDEDKMKTTSQHSKPPRKQSPQSMDDQTERTKKRGRRASSSSAPVGAHRSSMEEICRSFCFGDDAQQQFTNALPRGSRVTTEIVIPKRNAENMKNELGHDVLFNSVVHSRPEIDEGKDTVFVNSHFQVKQAQGMRRTSYDPKGKPSSAMTISRESQMTDPQIQADEEEYVERKKVKKRRTDKAEQKQPEARGSESMRTTELRRKQSPTNVGLPSRRSVEERSLEKNADRNQRIRDEEKETQPRKTRQGTKGTSDQRAARQSKLQTIEEQPSQEKEVKKRRENTERSDDRRQYDAQPRYPSYAAAVTDGSKSGVREPVRAARTPPKDNRIYDEQRKSKSDREDVARREPDRQQEKCQCKCNLEKQPSYNQAKRVTLNNYATSDSFMGKKVRETEQPKSAYAQPDRNAEGARRTDRQGATRSVESVRQAYGQQERQPQPPGYATDSRQIQSSMQPYGPTQDARSYQMPQRPLPASRPDYAAQTVSRTDGAAYSPTEKQMRPQEVQTGTSFPQPEFRPNYGDGYGQFAQPEKTQSPARSPVFTSQAAFKPDEGYQSQSAKPVYDQRETQQPHGYAQGTPPAVPLRPCQCYDGICRPFQPPPGYAYAPSDRQMIPQSPARQPSYAPQERAQPMYVEPGRQMAPPFQQGTQPSYVPSQAPVTPQMQALHPSYAPSTQQAFAQSLGPMTPQTQAGLSSYAPPTQTPYAPSGGSATPQIQAGPPSYAPFGQPSYAPSETPQRQSGRLSISPSTQPAFSQPGGPFTRPIQQGSPSFAPSAGTQQPITPQIQAGPPSFAPSTQQAIQPEAPRTPQLQAGPPSSAPSAVAQPPYAQPEEPQTPQSQTGPRGLTPSAVVTPSEGSQPTAEQQTAAVTSQVETVKPSIEPAKSDAAQDQPKEVQKLPSISKPAQGRKSLPVKAAVSQQKIPAAPRVSAAKPAVSQAKVAARPSAAQAKPRPSAAAKLEKEKPSPKPAKTDSEKSVISTPKKSVSAATISSAIKVPKVPSAAAKPEKKKSGAKPEKTDSEKSVPSTPKKSVSAATVSSASKVPSAAAKSAKEKSVSKPEKTDLGSKTGRRRFSTPKKAAKSDIKSSAAAARSQTSMLKELEKPTKPVEPKPAKKPAAKPKVKPSKPVSGSEYESEIEAPPLRTKPVMKVAEYEVATPEQAPPPVERKRRPKPAPPPAEPSTEEYSTEEEEEVVIPKKPAKEQPKPPARKAPVVIEESSTESETASSEDATAPVMEAAASFTESDIESEMETATSSESESGAEEVEEEAEAEEESVEEAVPEPKPEPVVKKLAPVEKPKPKPPFCKPVRKCSVGRSRSASKSKKPAPQPIVLCYTPRSPRRYSKPKDIVMCDTNAPSPLCECKQMCFFKPVRSTSCSSKRSTSQARKRSSSRG